MNEMLGKMKGQEVWIIALSTCCKYVRNEVFGKNKIEKEGFVCGISASSGVSWVKKNKKRFLLFST